MIDRTGDPDDIASTGDDGLLARLRAADPAVDLAPTDPVEVTRRLEEAMSIHHPPASEPMRDETTGVVAEPNRRGAAWLVAAAVAVLILGGIFFTQFGGDDQTPPVAGEPTSQSDPTGPADQSGSSDQADQPTVTALQAPTAQQLNARCMVPSPEVLALQEVAFLGTVTAVEGGQITFDVTTWYAGEPTDTVQVAGVPDDLARLLNAVTFVEGEDYYVSASDGRVTVCGLTGPADAERADLFQRAFGS